MFDNEEKKEIGQELYRTFFQPQGLLPAELYFLAIEFQLPVTLIAKKIGVERNSVTAWIRGCKNPLDTKNRRKVPPKYIPLMRDLLREVIAIAETTATGVKRNEERAASGRMGNVIAMEERIKRAKQLLADREE